MIVNIPQELRAPAKWVPYYLRQDPKRPDKKPRKMPSRKWGTEEDRKAGLKPLDDLLARTPIHAQAGFQRYVDKAEGFIYIDLDGVRNPDNGELSDVAQKIVADFNTYTEVSASKKGLHLVCAGELQRDFHRDGHPIEIYSGNSGKLIAMTGETLWPYVSVEKCQEAATRLLEECESKPQVQTSKEIEFVRASDIEPEIIEWLWQYRIPLGKLTVFAGPPDTGKSTVSIDLAARGSRGDEFTDGLSKNGVFETLMLITEDDLKDTAVPRLMAAGAVVHNVIFATQTVVSEGAKKHAREIALDTDVEALEDLLRKHPAIKLVIIDPMSGYLGNTKKNDDAAMRRVLIRLKELAETFSVAVVAIDHFNKNIQQAGIHRLGGAGAFGAVPRAIWAFVKDDDDEDKRTRLMLNAKLNVVSEAKKAGLKYRFKDVPIEIKGESTILSAIDWQGASKSHLDDVLHKQADPEKGKRGACTEWLKERLSKGPVLSREILTEAKESQDTVYRALKKIGRSYQKSGAWWMTLNDAPESGTQPPQQEEVY